MTASADLEQVAHDKYWFAIPLDYSEVGNVIVCLIILITDGNDRRRRKS